MKHSLSKLLIPFLLVSGVHLYSRTFPGLLPVCSFGHPGWMEESSLSGKCQIPLPDTTSICADTSLRLLLQEDTLAVAAGSISRTTNGSILIPGFYYPDNGIFYNMPYLLKCNPAGEILWSRKYDNTGSFPSLWMTATRIKELTNGDLLMTGQIGVPGTDDRRELAVWRLDRNGSLLWGASYESSLWSDPITGATEITGILEDPKGNILLCGNLKIFEASKFAFVLKLDPGGKLLWDENYAGSAAFAFGILLLQGNLMLVGGLDPVLVGDNTDKNLLWGVLINPANGQLLKTKGWYADFGQLSPWNSFVNANTCINLLDNGSISVSGTTYSDFRGPVALKADTLSHSIVANFSQDFIFQSGIMLSSGHGSNYYNTVTTQQPNGRIAFSRFVENNNLYNEDILYGNIQGNRIIRERFYQEPRRSSQTISNFLYYSPAEDIVLQTYWDTVTGKGGLELLRLRDADTSGLCNGRDTSLTFLRSYHMSEAPLTFDSIVGNSFHQTFHNQVSVSAGNISILTACKLRGVKLNPTPLISLDKDSVICEGTARRLDAGPGYSQYTWSNGSTNNFILASDTGRYWVSVTGQDGCKGSDTTYLSRMAPVPSGFLPPDTSICEFSKLTIEPLNSYQTYLWSDQSTNPTLTVGQPGLYVLEVTDSNHCTGKDSIRLSGKTCVNGLFVPNAFTPNGDGRNDIFRPLLVGNIVWFRFTVYNRWGQKVFETHTAGQGWDGRVGGVAAPDGAFVWYCQYQLEGQPETVRKGTVLLLH